MSDYVDSEPRHLLDEDRRATRDLEQEDWERDPDYRLYQPDPQAFTRRVIATRAAFACRPCECGGQCERCVA